MKSPGWSRFLWVPLCAGLAGCGTGPSPETAGPAPEPPPGITAAETPRPVPPEIMESLKARYPVLRKDPAPAPRPGSDANPDAMPERLREALPRDVLEHVTNGATYYADEFEGRRTASGIPFRQNQLVAAHRAYPFGTVLRVTNLANNRSVRVRVVDRGPFGAPEKARRTIIDLSRRAAEQLGYVGAGRARVKVEVLQWGEGIPDASA